MKCSAATAWIRAAAAMRIVAGLVLGCGGGSSSSATPDAQSPSAPRWFVVKELAFASGAAGFDLDGRDTTADDSTTSRNSCRRVAGSPTGVLADGPGGLDDNFGTRVLPIILASQPDFVDATNAALASGGDGLLLRVDDASVAVFFGASLDAPPRFDGGDRFAVYDSSVQAGDLARPIFVVPVAKLAADGTTGVFGPAFSFPLPLSKWSPGALPVVRSAGGGIAVDEANGRAMVGAVVHPSDFVSAFDVPLACAHVCAATRDSFSLLVDLTAGPPPFQDTTRDCDALSMAIAFDLAPVVAPTEVKPFPGTLLPPACACP